MSTQIPRDRPADEVDEIEITDEMVAAGMVELSSFDRRYQMPEDLVILIYEAMVKAQSARRSSGEISTT